MPRLPRNREHYVLPGAEPDQDDECELVHLDEDKAEMKDAARRALVLDRCGDSRGYRASVAQFDLSSLCMRTPMAQAPDEWLTALQRWATHSCA